MSDEPQRDVPEGAAVFPLLPPELGIHPITAAMLHAFVFLEGSDESVVHEAAALETLEYMAEYLQRLQGNDLRRVREDFETLVGYGRDQKWPKQQLHFLKSFLKDNGVGE